MPSWQHRVLTTHERDAKTTTKSLVLLRPSRVSKSKVCTLVRSTCYCMLVIINGLMRVAPMHRSNEASQDRKGLATLIFLSPLAMLRRAAVPRPSLCASSRRRYSTASPVQLADVDVRPRALLPPSLLYLYLGQEVAVHQVVFSEDQETQSRAGVWSHLHGPHVDGALCCSHKR